MEGEIIFLGTSDSIPTKKRNHTAILLKWGNENILFDCGEGTQRQFKYADINACKLTRLLITHWHADHILGIAGLFSTLASSNYSKTLEVYGPRGTKRKFELLEELYGKFGIRYNLHEVTAGKFFENVDFYLEAREMKHSAKINAYSFVIKDKLRLDKKKIAKLKLPNSPLLGRLALGEDVVHEGKKIKSKDVSYVEGGRRATVILDTLMNEGAVILAKGSTALICGSTFHSDDNDRAIESLHLTAKDAGEIAKRSKSKKLYLTHLSGRYEHNQKVILEEARKKFKESYLVKDLEKVNF